MTTRGGKMIPVIMFHGYDEVLAEKLVDVGCERVDEDRAFYWTNTLDEFAYLYNNTFQVHITAFGAKRILVSHHNDFRQR